MILKFTRREKPFTGLGREAVVGRIDTKDVGQSLSDRPGDRPAQGNEWVENGLQKNGFRKAKPLESAHGLQSCQVNGLVADDGCGDFLIGTAPGNDAKGQVLDRKS